MTQQHQYPLDMALFYSSSLFSDSIFQAEDMDDLLNNNYDAVTSVYSSEAGDLSGLNGDMTIAETPLSAFDATGLSALDMAPPFLSDMPMIVTQFDADFEASPDMSWFTPNADLHAGPWNSSLAMSHPGRDHGPLQIPGGQPRHHFITAPSFGASSNVDSGYVSSAPTDTPSLISAPTDTLSMISAPSMDMERPPTTRARRTFYCHEPGEHRTRTFGNVHDLERHQRSTHGFGALKGQGWFYRCCVQDCRNRTKYWDRKDNFRSHIVRRHFENKTKDKKGIDALVERSKCRLSPEEIQKNHQLREAARHEARRTSQRRQASISSVSDLTEPAPSSTIPAGPAGPAGPEMGDTLQGGGEGEEVDFARDPLPQLPHDRTLAPFPSIMETVFFDDLLGHSQYWQ